MLFCKRVNPNQFKHKLGNKTEEQKKHFREKKNNLKPFHRW